MTIQQFSSPNVIKVSVTHGTLKHYLFVRYGNNNVYIFTNKADDSIRVQRYIVRIPGGIFSSDADTDTDWIPAGASTVEASDVNENDSNGHTYSKHYSGLKYGRVMDCTVSLKESRDIPTYL